MRLRCGMLFRIDARIVTVLVSSSRRARWSFTISRLTHIHMRVSRRSNGATYGCRMNACHKEGDEDAREALAGGPGETMGCRPAIRTAGRQAGRPAGTCLYPCGTTCANTFGDSRAHITTRHAPTSHMAHALHVLFLGVATRRGATTIFDGSAMLSDALYSTTCFPIKLN